MGYRTVVILYNDQASTWENDPQLGKKISYGMSYATGNPDVKVWDTPANLHYGIVLECRHADAQSLIALDGYHGRELANSHWSFRQTSENVDLDLIKNAAEKLGYRLTKISSKK